MKLFVLILATIALAPFAAFAGVVEEIIPVAEPATLSLMAVGVAGAVIAARLRKKKSFDRQPRANG